MNKLLLIALLVIRRQTTLLIVGCDKLTEQQTQECASVDDGTAVEDIDGN